MSVDVRKITDVLVIGGGAAGARAAIESAKTGVKTLLIVKGIFGAGGCSLSPSLASVVGPWKSEGDSVNRHFEDMVIKGKQFLCDQALAKQQAEGGAEAMLELEKWGLVWDRDSTGKIALFPSGTLSKGSSTIDRWITFGRRGKTAVGPFWTGHGVVDVLRDQVHRMNIDLIQETVVSDLFLSNGKMVGALAFDYLNSKTILISCPAVVLATGDASQVYYPNTMVCREATGDGFALAYHVGASLYEMEQFEYDAMQFAFPDSARAKAVLETLTEPGELAHLVNSEGDRFLLKYGFDEESASHEDIAMAIYREAEEGRGGPHGGCFVDLRETSRDKMRKGSPGRLEQIERLHYDIRKDLIEILPAIHTTTGGIRINLDCEAGIPGLFAAGQVTFAVNDCISKGEAATGLVDAVFRGKIAGRNAAAYSRSASRADTPEEIASSSVSKISEHFQTGEGPSGVSVMRRLQSIMWKGVGIIKNESGLQDALLQVVEIRDREFPKIRMRMKHGKFNIELLEIIELRHMLVVAEMIIRSSIARKESRNRFHRSDYPEKDDEHYLKHTVIRKENGEMRLTLEPVEFPYLIPEMTVA